MRASRLQFLLAAVVVSSSAVAFAAEKPKVLFDGKSLKGWTLFLDHKDRSVPSGNDPRQVFKVEDGLIHVSGEEFGVITTVDEYQDYRLVVEFKWGTKKWPPRENVVRDSGILMHCVGPDKVWPKSIECQIQEHDCGDFWMVDGTTLKVDGKVEFQFKKKKADGEKPSGQWNTIEVICKGGTITNIVNGVVVNEGTDASGTKGKILLQSEGAEIYFRKVELFALDAE